LCLWDSRACQEHWTRESWPNREGFAIGGRNITHFLLINPSKVLLLPLHIKLGFMKQFAKLKIGKSLAYLCEKFPALSVETFRAGIFYGSQI